MERRVHELEALSEIGKTVSTLDFYDILDQVYKQMGNIMDLRNAQVQFALFDENLNEVTFPLAVEKDDGEIIDVVRGVFAILVSDKLMR